jgi:hypothetical protein
MGDWIISEKVIFLVMPGLVPGIHVFSIVDASKTWMAGSSPAMTKVVACAPE